jgi:DNA-binding response OmpR family regulator
MCSDCPPVEPSFLVPRHIFRIKMRAMNVLLVASGPTVGTIREPLVARGYSLIVADSAAAGEERLREGGIDVVLVEYEIPGGIDAFAQALERVPDPPPFVMLAGSADAPVVSARLGAAALLPKPVSVDDLHNVLRRMIRSAPTSFDDSPTGPVERPG